MKPLSLPCRAAVLVLVVLPMTLVAQMPDPIIFDQPVSEWVRRLGEKQNRKDAAKALRNIPAAIKNAVPALTKALKDEEAAVRRDCAFALGRIGPTAASAAADLVKLLDDDDFAVRFTAALALSKMGPAAKAAAADLEKKGLKDINPRVIIKAAEALIRIEPSKTNVAVAALKEIIKEKSADKTPRFEAAIALGRSAPAEAKDALEALAEGMQANDEYIRVNSAGAFARANPKGKEKAVEMLKRIAEDANEMDPLRVEAASALAGADAASAPKALNVLRELANSGLPQVKAAASEALRQHEPTKKSPDKKTPDKKSPDKSKEP